MDLLCYTKLYYAMICCAMLCYAMLYYPILCYTMLYNAILCYTMIHKNIIRYNRLRNEGRNATWGFRQTAWPLLRISRCQKTHNSRKKIKFGSGHALGVGAYREQLHVGRGRAPYGAHWGNSLPLANSLGKKGRGLAGFVATSAGLMLG